MKSFLTHSIALYSDLASVTKRGGEPLNFTFIHENVFLYHRSLNKIQLLPGDTAIISYHYRLSLSYNLLELLVPRDK